MRFIYMCVCIYIINCKYLVFAITDFFGLVDKNFKICYKVRSITLKFYHDYFSVCCQCKGSN